MIWVTRKTVRVSFRSPSNRTPSREFLSHARGEQPALLNEGVGFLFALLLPRPAESHVRGDDLVAIVGLGGARLSADMPKAPGAIVFRAVEAAVQWGRERMVLDGITAIGVNSGLVTGVAIWETWGWRHWLQVGFSRLRSHIFPDADLNAGSGCFLS